MVPAVEFKGVSKFFGDVSANLEVSFQVAKGSIHAIVGENGAGKSTAMKILFGLYKPDQGQVFVNGEAVHFHSPADAMKSGIGMVHQHFMLGEPFSALDNILLNQSGSAWQLLPRASQKQHLQEVAHRYGFDVRLESAVEDLSVGEQQRLEILKILSQNSDIIILDEPTAVLTPLETLDLFTNLRKLRETGKTILIITHKLKEVLSLTDQVTVFRNGKVTGNIKTSDASAEVLTQMMIGHAQTAANERTTSIETQSCLEFTNISAKIGSQSLNDVSFKVHKKEIVGIAGVEGNGQDVLIKRLLDLHAFKGKDLRGDVHSIGTVVALPEDRLRYGVLPSRPVYENFLLGQHKKNLFNRGPFLRLKELIKTTREAMKQYDVRPLNENSSFSNLSGGNQQKLVVARALSQKPDVVIAAQPTRGVDIGAIEFIHNQLRLSRDNGAGILLISSELDELMALSDRILVLYKGSIVSEFKRSEFNEFTIGKAMGGAH